MTGKLLKRPVTITEILKWANAYRAITGRWPTAWSGRIVGARYETWLGVDHALKDGLRGLPGGSSLARLLAEEYGVRNYHSRQALTEEKILQWADAHHQQTGAWPNADAGLIANSGGETWQAVEQALRKGNRGLPAGASLAQLLAAQRGVRNIQRLPPLTEAQILAWADAHFQRSGSWPTSQSGPITEAPGETWVALNALSGAGSEAFRVVRPCPCCWPRSAAYTTPGTVPTCPSNRSWPGADAFQGRTGRWPYTQAGAIPEFPEESWFTVNQALKTGTRGLPGGFSLAELLAVERGLHLRINPPRLSPKQILSWADAHYKRTGQWPTQASGPVSGVPDETWCAINLALIRGHRGLRGGLSLPQLLAKHRGKRHHLEQPRLSFKKILAWADAHFARTGRWPNSRSGTVYDAPAERWHAIDDALHKGLRGVRGGSSLLRLLVRKRGVRDPINLSPLTDEQILHWADLHFKRTGHWPKYQSGSIVDAPGETWAAVDAALRSGMRTLPGKSSLAKLLAQAGKIAYRSPNRPCLAEQEVLRWADLHFDHTGHWPKYQSGPIADAPRETWAGVGAALRYGTRGLSHGSSLAKLLARAGKTSSPTKVSAPD